MYHIPAGPHPDFPALEVLADVLVAAPSGRLYKALVETKKAASVSSDAGSYHDPGIFEVAAEVRKDRPLDEVRDEVLTIVEGVKDADAHQGGGRAVQGPPPEEPRAGRRRPEPAGHRAERVDRAGRLAAVLPPPRPAREGHARAGQGGRREVLPGQQPDDRRLHPDRQGRPHADPRHARRRRARRGLQGPRRLGAGESFDTDPEAIQRRIITPEPIGGVKVAFLPKKNRGETVSLVADPPLRQRREPQGADRGRRLPARS